MSNTSSFYPYERLLGCAAIHPILFQHEPDIEQQQRGCDPKPPNIQLQERSIQRLDDTVTGLSLGLNICSVTKRAVHRTVTTTFIYVRLGHPSQRRIHTYQDPVLRLVYHKLPRPCYAKEICHPHDYRLFKARLF